MTQFPVNADQVSFRPESILRDSTRFCSIQRELKNACRSSETKSALLQQLAAILQSHADVTALLYLERNAANDLTTINQLIPTQGKCDDRTRQQLIISSQNAVRNGQLDFRIKTNPNLTIAAVPVLGESKSNDALAAIFEGNPHEQQVALLMQLIAIQIATWTNVNEGIDARVNTDSSLELKELASSEPQDQGAGRGKDIEYEASAVLDLMQRVITAGNLDNGCARLTESLVQHLRCKRVAVGLCSGPNKHCKLSRISDAQRFDRKADISRAFESAMDEAIMRRELIAWRSDDESTSHGTLAQKKLCTVGQHQNCCSLPLINAESEIVGAVVVMDLENESSDRVVRFLNAAQQSIAIALQNAQAAEGNWLDKTWHFAKQLWKSARGKMVYAAVGIAASSMLLPLPYKVHCKSVVEPVVRRYVASPFEGTLEKSFAKAGDLVRQGDLLAKMDDREIEFERSSLIADWNQALKKRDAAQASHHYADQQIAQLEAERLDLKIKLLDHRTKQLEIRSPFDGMIASGDLERAEGAKLKIGQTLFEIAPLDKMIVEVAVADSDIGFVKTGQQVEIRLDAFPREVRAAAITRIEPRSELRDHENVFVAQVEVDNSDGKLRPGMKGRVRVRTDYRLLGWTIFHKAWEASAKALAW